MRRARVAVSAASMSWGRSEGSRAVTGGLSVSVGKNRRATSVYGSPWSLSCSSDSQALRTPRLDLCANLRVSLYAARAALAPLAASTPRTRRSCCGARARARANRCASCSRGRSARLSSSRRSRRRCAGAGPARQQRRRRAGGPARARRRAADARRALARVPRRRRDDRGHAAAARHRRRAAPYSTWTVEDAAGWEALQNCYLDSGCGDAGRRQQLVARLPALLAAAPAAAAPAVTAAAPPAAASARPTAAISR